MPEENKRSIQTLSDNLFPVVGVGASAGGMKAFQELVRAIPENSGMAYILIQHLAPEPESILTDILQKSTPLPVLEISDNIKVLPDHIYVIPANKIVTANDGILQLDPRTKGEKLNTIDVFFASLAEVHQGYSIGVILSGTGSDGTVGLKTIKDQGGITIVQDETSATYYGMPQSAVDAEVVDFVLAPADIPNRLLDLVGNGQLVPYGLTADTVPKEEDVFKQILTLLRAKRGIDFTYYKQTTIRRRILRRKVINRMERLKDYQLFLLENKGEQEALLKDILIPVTAFFRDPKIFELLCEIVFPQVFKEKEAAAPIRIWVAGCSTGEEAYSMAICLHEYFSEQVPPGKIQIFATDISEVSIAKARSGLYQKKDVAGISEARLKQFFTKTDGSYQVAKPIREMVVFATQNFLKDPPFAHIDLVSCRNVLIYMEPYLQKKALSIFHYSLNSNGFLVLGKSETPAQSAQSFISFNQPNKIYTRNAAAGKFTPAATVRSETDFKQNDDTLKNLQPQKDDLQKAADEAILSVYARAGVLVNDQLDIVQFRGSTGDYLEAPPGKASHAILKMAREGLAFELRIALHKAKGGAGPVKKEGIPVDKGKRRVSIEVIPLQNTIEPYFLVLFEASDEATAATVKEGTKKGQKSKPDKAAELLRIEYLEKELAQAREDMRAITEDQEAANEELQSANEELLSGSEELQSLNEELETSKEEIQSSNEELTILNQELIERNEQLIHTRKYAEAIVTTIHEPLLILTKDFRMKSANKSFYEIFESTEKQTEGKSFFEWWNGLWNVPGLQEKLQKILPDRSYFENFEVGVRMPSGQERMMALNARQLINEVSDEQLILLAMRDVTERKELEKAQELFTEELEKKVVERTKDLKESNIRLQHANENLQQFASIASHDLQEPLRKIKMFAAVLNKRWSENVPGEGKEVMIKIGLASDRMSQLIKELLQYSKIAYGNKPFGLANLDAILKEVLIDLDLLLTETKAEISYDEPLPVIAAIPLQVHQLFYNLVNNALKYRRQGIAPLLSISYRMVSTEKSDYPDQMGSGPYVEIRFTDNGIGFDQQFATQIFQIFERLHPADEFEGTGIGLALCKKITENHHGYIYARSREGDGASFYVVLPVSQ